MYINWAMYKRNVVYSSDGIVFSNKKDQTTDGHYKMNTENSLSERSQTQKTVC